MSQKPLEMNRIKQVQQLEADGVSKREIKLDFMRGFVICVLLSMYITGCKSGINKNNSEMVNRALSFDSTILLIEKKVVDLTSAEDLFAVHEFVGIYENPHLFSGDVISFIYRADRTDQQKLIAVYSMQNLSLNEYLKIFEKAIAQFNNSKLSEVLLENIISAPIGKEKIILNNSRNQSVLKLLNELKNNSRMSEKLRYRIEKIITRE